MIQTWFDVLETGNYTLINNCNAETFEKLYDEFFVKLENKDAKAYLDKNFNKYKLVLKTDLLIKSYETLRLIYNNATKIEYVIELEQQIINTIKVLHPRTKIIGTIENKLELIEKLIIINKNEFERIEIKEQEQKENNFIEQVVNLELALNTKIDTLNTSVEKYIYYLKTAKLKSKAIENGRS